MGTCVRRLRFSKSSLLQLLLQPSLKTTLCKDGQQMKTSVVNGQRIDGEKSSYLGELHTTLNSKIVTSFIVLTLLNLDRPPSLNLQKI